MRAAQPPERSWTAERCKRPWRLQSSRTLFSLWGLLSVCLYLYLSLLSLSLSRCKLMRGAARHTETLLSFRLVFRRVYLQCLVLFWPQL